MDIETVDNRPRVRGRIRARGRAAVHDVELIIDTGACRTHMHADVLDRLGAVVHAGAVVRSCFGRTDERHCGARMVDLKIPFYPESGQWIECRNLEVFDAIPGVEADGLLGMDVLAHCTFALRSGRLEVLRCG